MKENDLLDSDLTPHKRTYIFIIAGTIGLVFVAWEAFTLWIDWYAFREYSADIPGLHLKRPLFPIWQVSIVILLIPSWIAVMRAKKWGYFGVLAVLLGRIVLSFFSIRMNIPIYPAYEILALIVLSYRIREMKR